MDWREALQEMRPWILPILTALVSWWLYRRKYEAEVNDVFIESASKVVAMYEKTFEEWKCRVQELEVERDKLLRRVESIEKDYKQRIRFLENNYNESKRRLKLLAKVIVLILDATDHGNRPECIIDVVNGIKIDNKDRQFLNNIIQEVNHEL